MNSDSATEPHRKSTYAFAFAAIVFALLVAALLHFTQPLPPRVLVMATGPEAIGFDAIGQRYRDIFAKHGVVLELKRTNGSVDNIELLNDPSSGVSVALAESGVTNLSESPDLVSLGTLFYEPFWLFTNKKLKLTSNVSERRAILEELRLSFGTPGSGTYKIGREITAQIGLNSPNVEMVDLNPRDAVDALLSDHVQFIGLALPWDAPVVQRLLHEESVYPLEWMRADAHVALRPYLSKLILPRGIADLKADRPPKDLKLIATKVSPVAHADLHPALQHLFLDAASKIHGGPGVFNKAGEFPAAEPIDLPLSDVAHDYYRNGRPLLQRYLPFWLAALVSRTFILLIPVVGVAYPLFRLLPAIIGWSMRRRIFRLYGELKFLEVEIARASGERPGHLAEQLDRLEERANRMRVPIA